MDRHFWPGCLFFSTVLIALSALPARAQFSTSDSLGPRRAAITRESSTSPGSTSRRGPLLGNLNSSQPQTRAESSSTMSAPAFPRLTNVSSGGSRGSAPALFGSGSTSSTRQPAYTADNRAVTRTGAGIYQPGVLRVVKGSGTLPSDGGQVWREYDISPYTTRVRNQDKPEQAVIDWILRETGTEVWFSEPLGILSASRQTLRVYHTPEMQELVQDVVRRFVESDMEPHVLSVRIMTVGSPAWRSRALPLLKSIDIQSPGVEAWLLSRENAAVLIGELRRRGDYRENVTPGLQIQSGQTETIARTQRRAYARSVRLTNYFPGYETVAGQVEEGFALQLSPLMSLDGKTCDASIKCNIDQVERLVPVSLEVPVGGQVQRTQIQVPQLVSWRFLERFRWPADQVLLLSCGVIATPSGNAGANSPLGMLNPFDQAGSRADALLMVECRGKASEAALDFGLPPAAETTTRTATATATTSGLPYSPNSRGRY